MLNLNNKSPFIPIHTIESPGLQELQDEARIQKAFRLWLSPQFRRRATESTSGMNFDFAYANFDPISGTFGEAHERNGRRDGLGDKESQMSGTETAKAKLRSSNAPPADRRIVWHCACKSSGRNLHEIYGIPFAPFVPLAIANTPRDQPPCIHI